MKSIKTFILFLFSIGVYAQSISKINTALKLQDSLTYDVEIRIYQSAGTTNYSSLFRMFKYKSEKWTAEFYQHYAEIPGEADLKIEKQTLKSKSDMEFVYLNLLRSHILDLPSMRKIIWKLEKRGDIKRVEIKHKGKIKQEYELISQKNSILDGEWFKIQAKGWKTNEFEFSNPDDYLVEYPDVDELIFMCEILNILRNEFDIWKK